MYKYMPFLLLTIIFSGCVSPKPDEVVKKEQNKNKKVFEQEDTLIMFGLRAEQLRDYKSASIILMIFMKNQIKKSIYIVHYKTL